MDKNSDDGPESKRFKIEKEESTTPDELEQDIKHVEGEKVTISATQLFEGMLNNLPDGSKKDTLDALLLTLKKLRDRVEEPDPNTVKEEEEIVVVDEGTTNPPLLPELPPLIAPKPISPANSVRSTHSNFSANGRSVSLSPAKIDNKMVQMPMQRPQPAGDKVSVLDAIPPLAPTMAFRAPVMPPQEHFLRQQNQLKADRPRMLHPQLVSAMDTSSLMQKERAHQQALQAITTPAPSSQSPSAVSDRMRKKILEGIQANHNGKATGEEIQRYLKQNYFMVLENNAYIYVPNPWRVTPTQLQEFLISQASQQMPMMLPPQLPSLPGNGKPLPAILPGQLPISSQMPISQLPNTMLPPAPIWSPSSAFHQPNQLLPNTTTTSILSSGKIQGFTLPVIDPRPRKNDWSLRTVPLPTHLHVHCNCFPPNK